MLCLEKDTYYVSSSPTGQKETLCVTQFEEAEMDTAPMCSGRGEKLDMGTVEVPCMVYFYSKLIKTRIKACSNFMGDSLGQRLFYKLSLHIHNYIGSS